MRSASLLVSVCWISLVLPSSAAAQTATPDVAVTSVADAYVRAVVAKDARAVAAIYTDDAIEMPPNQPAVKGRQAVEEYYTKQFNGPGPALKELVLTHIESTVSGDAAFDVGTYRQTIDGPGGPMSLDGKYIVLLKRVGQEWKIAYVVYNDDMPMPPPPPPPPPGMEHDGRKPPMPPPPPPPPPPVGR